MNPFKNAKSSLNNSVIRFKHRIWTDIENADDDDAYLVIQNPKNKRISHVLDSDQERTDDPKKSNIKSVCGHYRVSRTSLFALMDEYDERSEIKTKEDIKSDDAMCQKCSQQI